MPYFTERATDAKDCKVPPNEDVDNMAIKLLLEESPERRRRRMKLPTSDLQLLKNEYVTLLR